MAAVSLNHISRGNHSSHNITTCFQIFGFEEVEESPNLYLHLHLIERNPSNNLPEGPWSATTPRGHHLCFSVPNFHSFLHSLKVLIRYCYLWFTVVCWAMFNPLYSSVICFSFSLFTSFESICLFLWAFMTNIFADNHC